MDVGGKKPVTLEKVGTASNRCDVCNDFTTEKHLREGKCLHCYRNPGYIVDGKPRMLQDYYDAEKRKEEQLQKLQLWQLLGHRR